MWCLKSFFRLWMNNQDSSFTPINCSQNCVSIRDNITVKTGLFTQEKEWSAVGPMNTNKKNEKGEVNHETSQNYKWNISEVL